MLPFGEIGEKVFIGIGTTVGVSFVWWAKKKVADPIVDFMVHMAPLLADVAAIKAEVHPNGGNSMRDEITRIGLKCDSVDNRTRTLEARQRGLIATLSRPYFETDAEFNWTFVNREVEKITGWSGDQLYYRRWIAHVDDKDRTPLTDEIEDAVQSGRGVSWAFRMHVDGRVVSLRIEAAPTIDPDNHRVVGWSGSLMLEGSN